MVVVVFHFSNKRQDGDIMLVNRNYINWPFILFFKARPYLILFKRGFIEIVKINIRREKEKIRRERKRGKVSSCDCGPRPGSNKWQKKAHYVVNFR